MLSDLPLWAVVAFSARCARRAASRFIEFAQNAPQKHTAEVQKAIVSAESAAVFAGGVDDSGDAAVIANNLFYIAYSIDNLKNEYYLGAGADDLRAAQSVLSAAYAALAAAYANLLVFGSVAHRVNTQDAVSNAEIAGYSAGDVLRPRDGCLSSAEKSASYSAVDEQAIERIISDFRRLASRSRTDGWDDHSSVFPKIFDSA